MISISTLIHKVACFLPEGLLQWNPILWVCIAGLMNSHIQACFWGCPLVGPTNTWQTLPISCHWGDDFPFVARHIGRVPGGWHLNDFHPVKFRGILWYPQSRELRRRYPFVLLNEYDGLNRSGASRSDMGESSEKVLPYQCQCSKYSFCSTRFPYWIFLILTDDSDDSASFSSDRWKSGKMCQNWWNLTWNIQYLVTEKTCDV